MDVFDGQADSNVGDSHHDHQKDDSRTQIEIADPPITVEFSDCETVRIAGELEDVVLSLFWWDDEGRIGTISEPVGGVDGDRAVTATAEFGEFTYGPIVSGIEGFTPGTPVVPGAGDVDVSNPTVEGCIAAVRNGYDGPGEIEPPVDEQSSNASDTSE